jgi:hypothetical protein
MLQIQDNKWKKDHIKGSCFKFLKEGHSFKDCNTNKECVHCGELNVHHRNFVSLNHQLQVYPQQ